MRVLFLTHAYPRHSGDVPGSFLHLLALCLVDAGVDVRVIAPHANGLADRANVDGIPVIRYRYAPDEHETLAYTGAMVAEVRASLRSKMSLLRMLSEGKRELMREARGWKPDVIHAHWWFPSGMSAVRAARQLQLPLVVTLHGSDVRLARGIAPARAIFRRVAGRTSAVTAVSEYLANVARHMAPDVNVLTLPMPVEVGRFSPPEPGEARSANTLLFVGRLTEQKGINLALDALARLPEDIRLHIVGDGPEHANLEAHAARIGVAARVGFLGSRPPAQLPRLYREAAAVVVPSHEEGLGLVAVEAVLCGTPVVAFASGGLVDALDNGRAGTLVPPGNVDALTDALREVLANPEAARERARNGRARAMDLHAPANATGRYLDLYERVRALG